MISNVNNILPVTRSQQVLSRYVYVWILTAIIGGVSVLVTLLSMAVINSPKNMGVLWNFVQIVSISLLMTNICIPAIYKVGMNKSRIFVMVVYLAFIMGGSALQGIMLDMGLSLGQNTYALIQLAVIILLTPLSFSLSKRWFEKR